MSLRGNTQATAKSFLIADGHRWGRPIYRHKLLRATRGALPNLPVPVYTFAFCLVKTQLSLKPSSPCSFLSWRLKIALSSMTSII
jgi:hypothetical protein